MAVFVVLQGKKDSTGDTRTVRLKREHNRFGRDQETDWDRRIERERSVHLERQRAKQLAAEGQDEYPDTTPYLDGVIGTLTVSAGDVMDAAAYELNGGGHRSDYRFIPVLGCAPAGNGSQAPVPAPWRHFVPSRRLLAIIDEHIVIARRSIG